jgi:hypothetical protein
MDDRSRQVSRRRTLGAMAAVGSTATLAGCSSFLGDGGDDGTGGGIGNSGATDVVVVNAAAESKTVAITVTEDGAEDPAIDETLTLAAGELVERVKPSKLPTTVDGYTVEVSVTDGPSETFEWTDPTVELAPLWIRIDGTRNITFLLQAG